MGAKWKIKSTDLQLRLSSIQRRARQMQRCWTVIPASRALVVCETHEYFDIEQQVNDVLLKKNLDDDHGD